MDREHSESRSTATRCYFMQSWRGLRTTHLQNFVGTRDQCQHQNNEKPHPKHAVNNLDHHPPTVKGVFHWSMDTIWAGIMRNNSCFWSRILDKGGFFPVN
mmetsp:Transcript_633/g.1245  ORF Transcript_633/g.1245 Transcript_633/m.1245 type:complete len:100 (-) Transcript_633:2416-2715(-)